MLKQISDWNFGASITVLTSSEKDTDFSRFSYINAWNDLSSEEPPQITIISVINQNKKSPLHDRWILMYDKSEGLRLGSSINSIGVNKVSEISVIYAEDVMDKYTSIIIPLVKHRVKEFENNIIKYESFDF